MVLFMIVDIALVALALEEAKVDACGLFVRGVFRHHEADEHLCLPVRPVRYDVLQRLLSG